MLQRARGLPVNHVNEEVIDGGEAGPPTQLVEVYGRRCERQRKQQLIYDGRAGRLRQAQDGAARITQVK